MGVRISELPEAGSIQTTEVIIISGEETKRMSYANLLAQLKNDLNIGQGGGSATTIDASWKGLGIHIISDGIRATVNVTGHLTSGITTKNAWVTVGTYPAVKPPVDAQGYLIINGMHFARYRWTPDGTFQIGFAREVATGNQINISSGGVVDMTFTFGLI